MSTAVLLPPSPVVPYSHHVLPLARKPSRRKMSRSEKPSGQKNHGLNRNPNSKISNNRVNRQNSPKSDSRDLVMENVRILKRGEAIRPISPSSTDSVENLTPCLDHRLGSDPIVLPKSSVSVYAGPAFISSPSPSSLPFPLFLKKAASKWEDIGTRSLRCLLQLDASL